MTTRQCDMVNRTFALTVHGTSFVTWMASDAKLFAGLRADDDNMLRIIRMALLMSEFRDGRGRSLHMLVTLYGQTCPHFS